MSEDDGFSEIVAKKVISQQHEAMQEKREELENIPEEYMETIFDFHKFTADPNLRRLSSNKIKEIDKNWVLGNYKAKDEKFISMCEDLITDIEFLLPNGSENNFIKTSLLRDIFARISLSRGRDGKAAQLFVTQISSSRAEITGIDKKKGKFFSFKRG